MWGQGQEAVQVRQPLIIGWKNIYIIHDKMHIHTPANFGIIKKDRLKHWDNLFGLFYVSPVSCFTYQPILILPRTFRSNRN